jgi:hypothetical protein
MVEMALLLPLILAISLVAIDLGRGIYYYSLMYNAAREAARYGIVNQQPTNSNPIDTLGMLDAAKSKAIGLELDKVVFPRSRPPSINGNLLTVVIEYKFRLITPFYKWFTGRTEFIVRSSSTMLIER